jgi:TonB family protein
MKSLLLVSLILALAPIPTGPSQAPRDTPPPAIENARRERDLRAAIATGTATKDVYLELAGLLNRQNRFDAAVEALRAAAALEPGLAEPQHRIAMAFLDKARGDNALTVEQKRSYIRQGLEAEDRAVALQPDYVDAIMNKVLLLRLQANGSTDPIEQKRLVDEADALFRRAYEMQRARDAQNPASPGDPAAGTPFAGFSEPFEQTVARLQPIRVGGNVRTPTKVKDAKPVYPPIAQSARVQGVVILEAVIDESGSVANARVLRSIPLLDEAALGTVSRWQFAPTDLNGRPVSVIMTVTVNFALMQ